MVLWENKKAQEQSPGLYYQRLLKPSGLEHRCWFFYGVFRLHGPVLARCSNVPTGTDTTTHAISELVGQVVNNHNIERVGEVPAPFSFEYSNKRQPVIW